MLPYPLHIPKPTWPCWVLPLFVNITKVFLHDPDSDFSLNLSPSSILHRLSMGVCNEKDWIFQNQIAPVTFSWSLNVLTPQVIKFIHFPKLKEKQRTEDWITLQPLAIRSQITAGGGRGKTCFELMVERCWAIKLAKCSQSASHHPHSST